MASAGDVDGDGAADVLIGAPYEDTTANKAGVVYLLTTLSPTTGSLSDAIALFGASDDDRAGSSVAGAGDCNDDGQLDVLIGAPTSDSGTSNGGAAFLVYGPFSEDLNLSEADVVFYPEHSSVLLGTRVAGPGDLSGDGLDDVAISAPMADTGSSNTGSVFIYHAPFAAQPSFFDAEIAGEVSNDKLGDTLSGDCDLNGDGYGDLIIGATGADYLNPESGAVYVLTGPFEGNLSATWATAKIIGAQAGELATQGVCAGDIDGDDVDDLLVGTPYRDSSGAQVDAGGAALFFGALSGVRSTAEADVLFLGEETGGAMGSAVAGGGDMNGDAVPDLILGSSDQILLLLAGGAR